MTRITHRFALAAAIAGAMVASLAAFRPPPGGGGAGGTGGGTIYYTLGGLKTTWTMDSSGGNNTQFGFGTYGPASTETHNGYRWFIDTRLIPDEFYPDGYLRIEVFALREDYDYYNNHTPETRVQLTDDFTLQPIGDGFYSLHWLPGDTAVSFKGRRWSGGEVVEGGIYTVPVIFDVDGNLIGGGSSTLAVALPPNADMFPAVRTYCWAPTGDKIAYEDTTGLYVADLLGNHTRIVNSNSHTPQWSPDGGKIAFTNGNLGISIVKPNGTSLKEIVRRGSDWTFDRPFWSPEGTHLVFHGFAWNGPYNADIFRVTSAGRSLTNLTNTPNNGGNSTEFAEFVMGWR